MAHNINHANGKYAFAAYGQPAWHGLGTIVDHAMTAEQAIIYAGLNYKVEKTPLFTYRVPAEYLSVPNKVATTRMDTGDVLGIVSPRYEVVQNEECFTFFDSIIDRQEAIYHTAGALGKGERIFLLAKLPDDILVAGEQINNYILLTNGHDGYHPMIACITPIRVVCNNTLTAALRTCTNRITLYHQKNVQAKLKEASRVMGMASKYIQEVQPVYEAMANTRLSDKQFVDYILASIAPPKEDKAAPSTDDFSVRANNMAEDIMQFAATHETQTTPAAKGTLWGAYNAVSGYLNWQKDYPSAEHRMKDISFGTGSRRIQKAFDNALSILK